MRAEFSMVLHETLVSNNLETGNVCAVNEDIYALLINYLLKEDATRTAQPHLIVGEAGCGKTFLIKRLYGAIKEEMDGTLYPVVIEGKSLYSTDDIWTQCSSLLKMEREKDSFDDVLEWQEHNSKRIVLFIDNIQYYFNRTDNAEHYGLRGQLNRVGAPIMIASSEKVLPAFTEYNAAFFDGFKIVYFKPVSISSVANMVDNPCDVSRLENMVSYMPKTIRSMFIAVDILKKSDDSGKDLTFLLDYFYSDYQGKFDVSTMQAQRILSALAQADTGLSLAEIREKTKQGNGKISPYLNLMTNQKIIKKDAKTLRGGVYSIVDPLFKLWLRHTIISR